MTPPDHVGDDPVPHAGGGSQGLSTARLAGLLNATYARASVPASLPAGTTAASLAYVWEPGRNRYNWKASNTRKIRASLGIASAINLTTGGLGSNPAALRNWLWIGDSKIAGNNASPVAAVPAATGRALTQLGGAVQAGNAGPICTYQTIDTRWTRGTGWTSSSLFATYSSSATASTFTSDFSGANCDIFYCNNSAAGFTYTVKDTGGSTISSGTVTPTGASNVALLHIGGLASAKSVVITPAGGGSGFFIGVNIYASTGLMMHNYGSGGATTANWIGGNFVSLWNIATACCPSPSAVFIGLGSNDQSTSVTAAAYQANLSTIVTAAKALSGTPDVVLVAPAGNGAYSDASWQPYTAAVFAVADALDVPVVSFADLLGPEVTAEANGLVSASDHIHETAAGYALEGQIMAGACLT